MTETYKAWLCIASGGMTTRAGDTFDEVLGESYAWPKSIPHAFDLTVGDVIAVWDTKQMLGISWIEEISESVETHERLRCPNPECKRLDIRERARKSPRFKCGKCGVETEDPITEVLNRELFIAKYAAGWSPMEVFVGADECRLLTVNPSTQHSIREIDIPLFEGFVNSLPVLPLQPFRFRRAGHVRATVRVRVGQGSFREKMREAYNDVCAFTGPNHQAALEAAHLYSYAQVGEHHEDGGLLLRRDVHRLFDKGLLAVNPADGTIDVHAEIAEFPQYVALQGCTPYVEFKPATREWLQKHWAEFRGASSLSMP